MSRLQERWAHRARASCCATCCPTRWPSSSSRPRCGSRLPCCSSPACPSSAWERSRRHQLGAACCPTVASTCSGHGGRRSFQVAPSLSQCWRSTWSATACATRSIRACDGAKVTQARGSRPYRKLEEIRRARSGAEFCVGVTPCEPALNPGGGPSSGHKPPQVAQTPDVRQGRGVPKTDFCSPVEPELTKRVPTHASALLHSAMDSTAYPSTT